LIKKSLLVVEILNFVRWDRGIFYFELPCRPTSETRMPIVSVLMEILAAYGTRQHLLNDNLVLIMMMTVVMTYMHSSSFPALAVI